MNNTFDFIERDFQDPKPEHAELETVSYDDKSLGHLEDDKYQWEYYGHTKYGRYAHCSKTNIKRTLTMGEFYGL